MNSFLVYAKKQTNKKIFFSNETDTKYLFRSELFFVELYWFYIFLAATCSKRHAIQSTIIFPETKSVKDFFCVWCSTAWTVAQIPSYQTLTQGPVALTRLPPLKLHEKLRAVLQIKQKHLELLQFLFK